MHSKNLRTTFLTSWGKRHDGSLKIVPKKKKEANGSVNIFKTMNGTNALLFYNLKQ